VGTVPPIALPCGRVHRQSLQGGEVIRVLLADDHDFVRSTLVELFTATQDIDVVAECSDGDQVLAAAERTHPDVVLLDLAMPRQTGLEAARVLLSAQPAARIVLLTANLSAAAVREAQAVGAVGYLLKGEDPADLVRHVRAVASGGTAWSPTAIASAAGTGEASS
jgi:DNA-binding NarL/FixJ family response regulator